MNSISNIKNTIKNNEGFDIVIIVASNGNSKYWEKRLKKTKKEVLPKKTKILCIEEKWNNQEGAGQLLGTLNAFNLAEKKIKIKRALKNKKSIAIYHTAGKGKRMAPLCGAEKNNKPAIKLPRPIKIDRKNNLFSLLEAVIYSTQIFSNGREGRICVFWGDQVAIPSNNIRKNIYSPIEIFGIKRKFPSSEKNWKEDWKHYGILIKKGEEVLQREKLTWRKIKKQTTGREIIFQSTGCFSVSFIFLNNLLKEFQKELRLKNVKLDIDPCLWMPLTSNKKEFLENGGNKKYWERINSFKKKISAKEAPLISVTDLGRKTLWWDYGNLSCYYKNILKTTGISKEGNMSRKFFAIDKFFIKKKGGIKKSIVINSKVNGKIENSVILNSKINKADIKNTIIINSEIENIKGRYLVLYYLKEKNKMSPLPNEIITDIKLKENIVRMKTKISRDGKKDWEIRLPQNPFSYKKITNLINNK